MAGGRPMKKGHTSGHRSKAELRARAAKISGRPLPEAVVDPAAAEADQIAAAVAFTRQQLLDLGETPEDLDAAEARVEAYGLAAIAHGGNLKALRDSGWKYGDEWPAR